MFRRKPPPPLELAMGMIDEAMEIALMYFHDRRRLATEDELKLMDRLAEALLGYHEMAVFISNIMLARQQVGLAPRDSKLALELAKAIGVVRGEDDVFDR